mgnify:CR=1 FL=1
MSFTLEKKTIEEYFAGTWGSTTPLYFENMVANNSDDEWVRLTIQNADSFQASLGNNPDYRYLGVLFFQIFVRPNTGSGRATALVDIIEELFRSQTIGGITFKVPVVRKIPATTEWYQVNVSIDFFRGE